MRFNSPSWLGGSTKPQLPQSTCILEYSIRTLEPAIEKLNSSLKMRLLFLARWFLNAILNQKILHKLSPQTPFLHSKLSTRHAGFGSLYEYNKVGETTVYCKRRKYSLTLLPSLLSGSASGTQHSLDTGTSRIYSDTARRRASRRQCHSCHFLTFFSYFVRRTRTNITQRASSP